MTRHHTHAGALTCMYMTASYSLWAQLLMDEDEDETDLHTFLLRRPVRMVEDKDEDEVGDEDGDEDDISTMFQGSFEL